MGRGRSISNARRRVRRRLVLVPLLLFACLALPKVWQGEFSVDTGWYSAIGVQAWRLAAAGDPGALWTLMGEGGAAAGGPDGRDGGRGVSGGEPYFNKPPLVLWIHGFVLWVLGVSLWAARLPTVLAGAGCVLATVWLASAGGAVGRAQNRRAVALTAGAILALTAEFTRHTHAVSMDMWLTLFLFMGAAGTVAGAARGSFGRAALWGGLGLGLALMTKPMVGLLLPVVLALWAAGADRRGSLVRGRLLGAVGTGVLVGVAIAAPWHLSMWALHGEAFTGTYFGSQTVGRATGELEASGGSGNPLFCFVTLLKAYWPWLPLAAAGVWAAARANVGGPRASCSLDGEKGRAGLGVSALLLIWVVVWLGVLTVFPDRRSRYMLPVYPALAVLSAMWLVRCAPAWLSAWRRPVLRGAVVVAPIVALVISLAPVRVHGGPSRQWTAFFEWVDASGAGSAGGSREAVPLFDASMGPAQSARVYLRRGFWPTPVHDTAGNLVRCPEPGAFIAYHDRGDLEPGEGEEVVCSEGSLVVTRLVGEVWAPVEKEQPVGRPR